MKHLKCFAMIVIVTLTLVGWADVTVAAPIDDLIAGAKKEGVLEFYGPSTLTPKGCQQLGDALNKKYGLNIDVRFNPSGSMGQDVGKLIGMSASGVPPDWDVMVVTDAHHGRLFLRKLHIPYDYKSLGVDPQMVSYDSGTVAFANQIVLFKF